MYDIMYVQCAVCIARCTVEKKRREIEKNSHSQSHFIIKIKIHAVWIICYMSSINFSHLCICIVCFSFYLYTNIYSRKHTFVRNNWPVYSFSLLCGCSAGEIRGPKILFRMWMCEICKSHSNIWPIDNIDKNGYTFTCA